MNGSAKPLLQAYRISGDESQRSDANCLTFAARAVPSIEFTSLILYRGGPPNLTVTSLEQFCVAASRVAKVNVSKLAVLDESQLVDWLSYAKHRQVALSPVLKFA